MNALLDDLCWRGLIAHSTDLEALGAHLDEGPVKFYVGFDPTAPSLHMGNLVQLLFARRLQQAGHKPHLLVGGATGQIGDPKETGERVMNSKEVVAGWVERIRAQAERFVSFEGDNAAVMVNNLDWTAGMSILDFLRDVGKHFPVNRMLARDVVARRLDSGISYTEFSYVLLQSMDYRELYRRHGVTLQHGGSDQWGNITAGVELLRRSDQVRAHALATPLLTKADGTKFGKTEAGAVWLDPRRTSPYRFYQFWFNTDDRDVERLLKLFTFLPLDEIRDLMEKHVARPEERTAQRRLALEATKLVHGEGAALSVVKASSVLFDAEADLSDLTEETYAALREEVPFAEVSLDLPAALLDVLTVCGAFESRGEAKRAIRQGGVSLNGARVSDEGAAVSREELGRGRYLFVRIGRKRFHLVAFS